MRGSFAESVQEAMRAERGVEAPPIRPAPRDKPLPLSFAQQRLWFLDQLEPISALYNLSAAFRLHGRLEAPALEETLSEIVRRHESLRTMFESTEEAPLQVVLPARQVRLTVEDISLMPEREREAEALSIANKEGGKPFDLSRGALIRASLLKIAEEDHVLLITMHHIVSDGWSMGILTREITALYEAYTGGKPSPLPELEIQYADYANWQQEWLRGSA